MYNPDHKFKNTWKMAQKNHFAWFEMNKDPSRALTSNKNKWDWD